MAEDQKLKIQPSKYVKLNVGGTLFYTTLETLTKRETSLKTMMLNCPNHVLIDSEGCIIIDRSGKHFGTILNYIRDGSTLLPDNLKETAELLSEAQYFKVVELAKTLETILAREVLNNELICRVPLVTSSKEAHSLISSTKKPVIKLLFNRHNNKYSYTHSSDDNLLKNLELFDKLTIRYFDHVLFIKDVDEVSQEICCWSFYKCGKYYKTVCCTSNVYETDKMYTKVEFPEARINEEADVILKGCRPSIEIMKFTTNMH